MRAFLIIFFMLVSTSVAAVPGLERDLTLGYRVWGTQGCSSVAVSAYKPGDLPPSPTVQDPDAEILGLTWPDTCKVELDVPNLARLARFSPSKVRGPHYDLLVQICSTVVHEIGHAEEFWDPTGVLQPDGARDHHHSPNPKSVMYPRAVTTYAPCRALWMDKARKHARRPPRGKRPDRYASSTSHAARPAA